MSLATTCPNCSTCFRVVQDQLRVSEGWVRCGNCQQVFNALESLFDLDAPHEPVGLPASPAPDPHRGVWQTEASARWMRRQDRQAAPGDATSLPSHPSEREVPLSDDLRAALHAEPITQEGGLGDEDSAPQELPAPEPEPPVEARPVEPSHVSPAPATAMADVEVAPFAVDDPGETAFAPYSIIEERQEPRFEPTAYLPAELQPEIDPGVPPSEPIETPSDASSAPAEPIPGTLLAPSHEATHPVDTADPPPPSRSSMGPIEEAPQALLFQTPAADDEDTEEEVSDAELAALLRAEETPPPQDETGEGSATEPPSPASDPSAEMPAFGEGAADAPATDEPASSPAEDAPTSALPGFVLAADRRARWQRPGARWALALTGLALAAALVSQVAWHWRELLAVTWPASRAPLTAACEALNCELQAPRRLEALVVDNTALSRPPGVSGYRLSVHLRNRADHAVAVPSFDLALTDAQGNTISRRVIRPEDFDYHEGALAAQAEAQWTLEFSLGEGSLVGYTLAAFYP